MGDRDQLDMRVRDFQAFDHESDAFGSGSGFDGWNEFFCCEHPGAVCVVCHLKTIGDLRFWHEECHAWLNGIDVEKGEEVFIFPDFMARDFAVDDAREDGGHRK